ncbi:uncharacterized protein LOC122816825 isoform X3 [Protopterus annectens]|uniref:uncharacterized protein LOC122816825 isoform X3 n=1 Tax=Protopterus annectens TaxID=7888 RepID=UPI001CF9A346|nr:uncharacterized protein LOC122816825 isoform X3 [Protopterus annectens]
MCCCDIVCVCFHCCFLPLLLQNPFSNEISAADFAEPEENENVESIKYVELDLSRKPTEKKCVLLDNSCEYDYPAASVMPSSHGRHITYAELAQPTKHKGRKVQSKTAVHDDAQHL